MSEQQTILPALAMFAGGLIVAEPGERRDGDGGDSGNRHRENGECVLEHPFLPRCGQSDCGTW